MRAHSVERLRPIARDDDLIPLIPLILRGERLDPGGAHVGAENDDAPLERLAPQRLAEQRANHDQKDRRDHRRVQQVRSPQRERRH
jgi:hypothetical protein